MFVWFNKPNFESNFIRFSELFQLLMLKFLILLRSEMPHYYFPLKFWFFPQSVWILHKFFCCFKIKVGLRFFTERLLSDAFAVMASMHLFYPCFNQRFLHCIRICSIDLLINNSWRLGTFWKIEFFIKFFVIPLGLATLLTVKWFHVFKFL